MGVLDTLLAGVREGAVTDPIGEQPEGAMRQSKFTVGKCKTKGCKTKVRSEVGAMSATCPDHGPFRLDHVWGVKVEKVKCGAMCRNAVGPSCDCSCGGANHGAGHVGDAVQGVVEAEGGRGMSVLGGLLDARAGGAPLHEGFEENLHPRDLFGKFKTKVEGLKAGDDATLPDGTRVLRAPTPEPKFYVHGKTGPPTSTGSPLVAATRAMDVSAQNSDENSVGGTKTYATYVAAAQARDRSDPGGGETKQATGRVTRGRAPERAAGVKAGVKTVSGRGVERGGGRDLKSMSDDELHKLRATGKHGTTRAAAQNELRDRGKLPTRDERGGRTPAGLSRSGLAGDKSGGAKVTVEGVELRRGMLLAGKRTVVAVEDGKVALGPNPGEQGRVFGNRNRTAARQWYKADSKLLKSLVARHKRESQ